MIGYYLALWCYVFGASTLLWIAHDHDIHTNPLVLASIVWWPIWVPIAFALDVFKNLRRRMRI
jgi:hypothetical protein